MTSHLPTLPTIGAIAERYGVLDRDVERILRARSLKPVARAGIARVFLIEAVEEIGRELRGAGEGHDDG